MSGHEAPWSVGKICDSGYEVKFDKAGAQIIHAGSGKHIGTFPRKQGLYMGTMQLKNPESQDFPRLGR